MDMGMMAPEAGGDSEALMQRIAELENRDKMRGFMDKYGSRFNGDEGIGTAILAEFNRRGIDTSAADEAVQEIIDQLRQDASALLDKLTQVEQAVGDALNGGGEPGMGEMPPEAGGMPPAPEGMPPEAAPPPEGAPPPDAGGMPPEGGAPPAPEGMPPEGAPPPEGVVSDAGMKNIVSDMYLKKRIPDIDDETRQELLALGNGELTEEDVEEALKLLAAEEGGAGDGGVEQEADALLGGEGGPSEEEEGLGASEGDLPDEGAGSTDGDMDEEDIINRYFQRQERKY